MLEIVDVPIGRVQPYENNPRVRTDAAVQKVARSIREFGWRQPVVVDPAYVVIVGHARLAAAESLQLETVPVHIASDLSPERVRAYRLADNRTNEDAEWDFEALAAELAVLQQDPAVDILHTGFDSLELEDLLNVKFEDDDPAAEESSGSVETAWRGSAETPTRVACPGCGLIFDVEGHGTAPEKD